MKELACIIHIIFWIASFLIMTNLVTPSLRGTKQSRSSRLYLDCFVPRNDGDLYRHHSFLQGIYPMPAARNDGDTYRHCEVVIERSRNTRSNPDIYNL